MRKSLFSNMEVLGNHIWRILGGWENSEILKTFQILKIFKRLAIPMAVISQKFSGNLRFWWKLHPLTKV
jgi:hypothetical protein